VRVLPIRKLGDPILRKPAKPVKTVTEEIVKFSKILVQTMFEAKGIGLAAPQVGKSLRIFALNLEYLEPGSNKLYQVLINPKLIWMEGEEEDEEGCLSIPGIYHPLKRPERVVIEAEELINGKTAHVEIEASGLHARTILHEIDHLDGILFIDRLDMMTRVSLIREWELQNKKKKTE
jgi:peptide deformylase